jgi:hypothetical protein
MAKTKKVAATKAASVKPSAAAKTAPPKSVSGKDDAAGGKRKLGLRGAAPWAARHAAKHAAEARARAAEPPLPGSARATIRTPIDAEDIKERVRDLHAALAQIKGLRKNLAKNFFEIGLILKNIEARKFYEAKRFPSFESFVEREIDLGKTTALRLVRVVRLFQREGALEVGMDRIFAAVTAIDSGGGESEASRIPQPPQSTTSLPMRPPGR